MHLVGSHGVAFVLSAVMALGCSREPTGPIQGAGSGVSTPSESDAPADPLSGGSPVANPAPAAKESEPNDSPKKATPLPPIATIDGVLDGKKDEDWYRIDPSSPPEELSCRIRPTDDLDVRLEVGFGNSRQAIRWVDNASAGGDEVLNPILVRESAWLRVRRSKRQKGTARPLPYQLEASLSPVAEDSEREPNGRNADATKLQWKAPRRGYLNTPDDKDTFRLELPKEPGPAQISVSPLPPGAEVRIEGQTPTTAKATGTTELTLGPLHLAGKSARIAVVADGQAGVEEPYVLTATPLPPTANGAEVHREPNDNRKHGVRIELEAETPSTIGWPADRDVFIVNAPKRGGAVRVEVTSETLRLALRRWGDTSPWKDSGEAQGPGVGRPAVLPNVASTGPFAFEVRAIDGALPVPTGDYVVVTSWRDAAGEEREPNDPGSKHEPTPLELGFSMRGYVGWTGDVDRYLLDLTTLEAGQILTVRLRAPQDLGAAARLLSAEEKPSKIAELNAIPPGEERAITHFFAPGRYLVEVASSTEGGASPRDYRLTVVR